MVALRRNTSILPRRTLLLAEAPCDVFTSLASMELAPFFEMVKSVEFCRRDIFSSTLPFVLARHYPQPSFSAENPLFIYLTI